MRLPIYLVLVALMLGLAACGDDEPSQSASGQTRSEPSASGTSGAGGEGSSEAGGQAGQGGGGGSTSDEQGSQGRGSPSSAEERARLRRLLRRPNRRRGDFKGASRTAYYEARSRCLAIPLRALARSYGAGSEQPDDVAEAYAERQAPTGESRRAAVAGCLDGITSRVRRGL